jgi:DNA-binding NtrC family response regulator
VILSDGEPLTNEDFSLEIEDQPLVADGDGRASVGGLPETEKEMILAALKKTGGNKTEAAKLLRISRRRLYSRMKIHSLKP